MTTAQAATVRALPQWSPTAQRHSWFRDDPHRCRWCRIVKHSEQGPRGAWFTAWTWPDGTVGDNRAGGKPPACPGPSSAPAAAVVPAVVLARGTRVRVPAGALDAAGRILPVGQGARVVTFWQGPFRVDDGPDTPWYDLMFDGGRFRAVAAHLVQADTGARGAR